MNTSYHVGRKTDGRDECSDTTNREENAVLNYVANELRGDVPCDGIVTYCGYTYKLTPMSPVEAPRLSGPEF